MDNREDFSVNVTFPHTERSENAMANSIYIPLSSPDPTPLFKNSGEDRFSFNQNPSDATDRLGSPSSPESIFFKRLKKNSICRR